MSIRARIRRFDGWATGLVLALFPKRPWYRIFTAITFFGEPIVIMIITAIIVAAGVYTETPSLLVGGFGIPITVVIGGLIKLLVERARPVNEYSARLITFSFPSGHSTGSVVTYGVLAWALISYLSAPWVYIVVPTLLLLLPFAVGISRVHLGAHYPSDVMAGWLLGSIGLLVIIIGMTVV